MPLQHFQQLVQIISLHLLNEAVEIVFPTGLPSSDDDMRTEANRLFLAKDLEAEFRKAALHSVWERWFIDDDDFPGLMYDFVLRHQEEFGLIHDR